MYKRYTEVSTRDTNGIQRSIQCIQRSVQVVYRGQYSTDLCILLVLTSVYYLCTDMMNVFLAPKGGCPTPPRG